MRKDVFFGASMFAKVPILQELGALAGKFLSCEGESRNIPKSFGEVW